MSESDQLPRDRNASDDRLKEILDELDDNELHGLKFGMLPARYQDDELTGPDVARLMNLSPEGHF